MRNGTAIDWDAQCLADNSDNCPDSQYSTHLFTATAQTFVSEHVEGTMRGEIQPMLLFLAYQAPHSPLQLPARYELRFETQIADERRRHVAGIIAAMDEGVGNVSSTIDQSVLGSRTLYVFSTDK